MTGDSVIGDPVTGDSVIGDPVTGDSELERLYREYTEKCVHALSDGIRREAERIVSRNQKLEQENQELRDALSKQKDRNEYLRVVNEELLREFGKTKDMDVGRDAGGNVIAQVFRKPKFRLEDYPGNYAMHCPKNWQAEIFCDFLNCHGRTWSDRTSYASKTYWKFYKKRTIYHFNEGSFSYREFAKEVGCAVLEFSDFDWSEGR